MNNTEFQAAAGLSPQSLQALRDLLNRLISPYVPGDRVGIKLHWGERGNETFLSARYAREIVLWLKEKGATPCVFDTTVLYSGGRRSGADTLKTAAEHNYSEDYLGCPVIVADGMDGREVSEITASYKHFKTVQVADILSNLDGYLILSHFKGHMLSGFGGAIKNLSMGFASRAQKQRMHSNAHPVLSQRKCSRCGVCIEVCPVQAGRMDGDSFPAYDLELCIGCAQCIAMCPEVALRVLWDTDVVVFQEKLVETAAAVWRQIAKKTILLNILMNITSECDCLTGKHPAIAADIGFLAGYHPVSLDEESMARVGAEPFDQAHPGIPWRHQFAYSRTIGFKP
ncbi:MAG: DUF362 domain-containing protein [Smithellaceae bacterium]|nr:DUF362 domain-containing protein [Smithellaceae bacterium]